MIVRFTFGGKGRPRMRADDIASWVMGMAAAAFGLLLGDFTPWMAVLLIASVSDWLAGTWVACKEPGAWDEHINAKGIAKKLGILMILVLCHAIDRATAGSGNPGILQFGGTLWYVAAEGLSLLKNLRRLDVPIFPGLGEALVGIEAKSGPKGMASQDTADVPPHKPGGGV